METFLNSLPKVVDEALGAFVLAPAQPVLHVINARLFQRLVSGRQGRALNLHNPR